ncbi:HDOD domain-containing protein [Vibrio nitrifigilis]|uniref:HDOD domain-containing protein n=1 Tax=Vibrio nitrifigilis TaxID=2789781 RepID=A0ABS0GMC4_9VIBR|nr:HDOD domain-containing protein [Vibrio nitrifigilis]MBF9003460.1 HDOD domain-containing protein [Vibrio nitrifigilis]
MIQATILNRLNEIPRLSKVLQDLLDLVNKEEIDFKLLAQKMELDQLLSARLLRMANSAYFGGQRDVSTINDALIRVGMESVRTLVVASVLSNTFSDLETLDLDTYWTNTFETALITKKIAEQIGLDTSEAFTTGVLHDIGELIIHSLIPEQAKLISERVKAGESALAVEEELLGVSSPRLGAMLAKSWKFPENMVDAIEHFDCPDKAKISSKLAFTLHFSRDIHQNWDELLGEKQKVIYIAEHQDAKVLNIPASFEEKVSRIRGSGKELAQQMIAA